MATIWNDNAPIYRQLKEQVVAMILDGRLQAGDVLPSVRQIAADFQLNPITVSRAYQELVDEKVVEAKRGLGMFVLEDGKEKLLASERQRFLLDEWPSTLLRIERLGLDLEQLVQIKKKQDNQEVT